MVTPSFFLAAYTHIANMHKNKIHVCILNMHPSVSKSPQPEGALKFDSARPEKKCTEAQEPANPELRPKMWLTRSSGATQYFHCLGFPSCKTELITPQRSCGNELPALCTVLQAQKMQRPAWMRVWSQGTSFKMPLPSSHALHLPIKRPSFPFVHWSQLYALPSTCATPQPSPNVTTWLPLHIFL